MSFPLLLIGLGAGVISGLFGVGGGIVIVPALLYYGLSPHTATGTSLAILLPPVGLAAVFEYYRNGNVDIRAAVMVAIGVFIGGWIGALLANKVSGPYLKLGFGIFVLVMGISLIYGAFQKIGSV